MAKKEAVPVKQFNEFPELVACEFDLLVREYRAAHVQETKAQAIKNKLKVEIEALLELAGEKSVGVGNFVAVQCDGSSASTINKLKLVEMGVPVDTIVACTDPGKSYTYVQVLDTTERAK